MGEVDAVDGDEIAETLRCDQILATIDAGADKVVDANGDVRDAHPFSSTQYRFEDNAVKAVSQWKFKPGKWHGRSVTTHVRMPIKFTLSDKDREL